MPLSLSVHLLTTPRPVMTLAPPLYVASPPLVVRAETHTHTHGPVVPSSLLYTTCNRCISSATTSKVRRREQSSLFPWAVGSICLFDSALGCTPCAEGKGEELVASASTRQKANNIWCCGSRGVGATNTKGLTCSTVCLWKSACLPTFSQASGPCGRMAVFDCPFPLPCPLLW